MGLPKSGPHPIFLKPGTRETKRNRSCATIASTKRIVAQQKGGFLRHRGCCGRHCFTYGHVYTSGTRRLKLNISGPEPDG